MLNAFITAMGLKIIAFISSFGYWGIGIGMAIESCNIPLPSEVILPFGGYLVSTGQLNFFGAALAGTIGGTIGSLLSYYIGFYGGRAFLEKYGSYIWLPHRRLVQADHWFERYGSATIFLTRLLPGIRTFISLPAGAARMNLVHFVVYTFTGSLLWSLFLTYIGLKLGDNWDAIKPWFHRVDLLIIIAGLLLILYCWWRWKGKKSRI